MKISIITVCFNSVATIEKTIKSVLSQTYENIEYIIVDGSSKDGTLEIIKKYENKITKWNTEPDKGLYDAMNKGIHLSSGDLVGILNSDDIFTDVFVLENIAKFHQENDIDISVGNITQFNKVGKPVRKYSSKNWTPENLKIGFMPPHPSLFFKRELIDEKLPGIRETSIKFANVDPVKDPIPVVPTVHYMMGGIPTTMNGQVRDTTHGNVVEGFYAVGECACVSVHGANRLGSNSLLDLIVFGRAAGIDVINRCKNNPLKKLPSNASDITIERLSLLEQGQSGEDPRAVGNEIRKVMQEHCGVFRFPELMEEGVKKIKDLRVRVDNLSISDTSKIFNTARIEALEVKNLIEVAEATIISASNRKESRGSHSRSDYPKRDDDGWLKHTVYNPLNKSITYRPVNLHPLTVDSFPLKERVY